MAIILMEEVLVGLDDVKDALAQAAATLEILSEDLHPDFGEDLRERLMRELLHPVQAHLDLVERLQDQLASRLDAM